MGQTGWLVAFGVLIYPLLFTLQLLALNFSFLYKHYLRQLGGRNWLKKEMNYALSLIVRQTNQ